MNTEFWGMILYWGSMWLAASIILAFVYALWRRKTRFCYCDICAAETNVPNDGGFPAGWGVVMTPRGRIWGVACTRCFDSGQVGSLVDHLIEVENERYG